jgi:hypothetical protein
MAAAAAAAVFMKERREAGCMGWLVERGGGIVERWWRRGCVGGSGWGGGGFGWRGEEWEEMAVGAGEGGIGFEGGGGETAGGSDERGVADEVAEAEVGEPALGGAHEVAGASDAEVGFCDGEPVGGLLEELEASGGFGVVAVGDEDAEAFVGATADAAAELVELGEAEAVGVEDEDDGGVRDVDTDFDDGGGAEGVDGACAEGVHEGVFFVCGGTAVEEPELMVGETGAPCFDFAGGGADGEGIAFVDEGEDEVGLAALVELGAEEGGDLDGIRIDADGGGDGFAAGRHFVERGEVEIAVERHG